MGTPTLQRPLKTGNVRTYVDEVTALAPNDAPILAAEVDADFSTLFDAWNNSASTFPPSGAAGGDLAGSSYPNPVIAPLAVTDAKIASIAYAKVTGHPTSYPPSGAAGGSLAGTFPTPSIAASAVRGTPSSGGTAREIAKASIWGGDDLIDLSVPDAKIAALAWAKLTGVPSVFPPNPTLLPWSVSGANLSPTDPTKVVNLAAATAPLQPVVWGTRTIKARLRQDSSVDEACLIVNYIDNATSDNAGKPTWLLSLDVGLDNARFMRRAAPPTAPSTLLLLDSTGAGWFGAPTIKTGVWPASDGTFGGVTVNHPWQPHDLTKPSWSMLGYTTADQFLITHRAANATAGTVTTSLLIYGSGLVAIPGPAAGTTDRSSIVCGSDVRKGRVARLNTIDWYGITLNNYWDGTSWQRDDAAQPAWRVAMQIVGADYLAFERVAANGTNTSPLYVDPAGNLTIAGGSAVKPGGGSWVAPSDPRLKKTSALYTTGLEAVCKLEPITYQYNGLAETLDDGRTYHGFDANAVLPVMPEMVTMRAIKLHPDDPTPTELLFVNTSPLLFALVNAVRELATRLTALEVTP